MAVGTVISRVALDTIIPGGHAVVLSEMSRWDAMTLPAETVRRLRQQTGADRAMWLVADNTATALRGKGTGCAVFIKVWTGFLLMTRCAQLLGTMAQCQREIGITKRMTTKTVDKAFDKRMVGATSCA